VYSQDVLEDLRSQSDIVEVLSQYMTLHQKGANHMGLCPFHREKTPSFSVSAPRQLFHCFGCGESGNVISFIMKIENMPFLDAIKFLADRIGFRLPELTGRGVSITTTEEKNRIYEAYQHAARFYYNNLISEEGKPCGEYLDHRKIDYGIRRKFGLGYATKGGLTEFLIDKGFDEAFLIKNGFSLEGSRGIYDRFRNRLMFPIIDVQNKFIGFGGRIIGEGEPKYLNSPETPVFDKSRTLYGLNFARLTKKRTFILVEGYMDVIALYQVGIKSVVAALGTAFTAHHARILKRYCDHVIILFDSDEAGTKAVIRAIPHLYAAGLGIKVCHLEDAKDPDEFLQVFGKDALSDELMAAVDFIDFQIKAVRKDRNLDDTAQRISFIKEAAVIISRLKSPVERESYARDMAAKYAMGEDSLKEEVAAILGNTGNDFIAVDFSRANLNFTPAQSKAFSDAAFDILVTMSADSNFCSKVTEYLTGEEFLDETLTLVFNIITQARQAGKELCGADIVTMFENDEEQMKKVAKIFVNPKEVADISTKKVAIAQQVYIVKETFLQHKIHIATKNGDNEMIMKLGTERKGLKINPFTV